MIIVRENSEVVIIYPDICNIYIYIYKRIYICISIYRCDELPGITPVTHVLLYIYMHTHHIYIYYIYIIYLLSLSIASFTMFHHYPIPQTKSKERGDEDESLSLPTFHLSPLRRSPKKPNIHLWPLTGINGIITPIIITKVIWRDDFGASPILGNPHTSL